MQTRDRLPSFRRGRNIGAAIGAVIFLGPGFIPALFFSSYCAVSLIAWLSGGTFDQGAVTRLATATAIVLNFLLLGSLLVVLGATIGTAVALITRFARLVLGLADESEKKGAGQPLYTKHRKTLSAQNADRILARLRFLHQEKESIRSLLIVGSAAYGLRNDGSDIDVVVVAADQGSEQVREFVFGREIDDALATKPVLKGFEFTVLSEKETKTLVAMGSPFAFAMRHGLVLQDDGFLAHLLQTPWPSTPERAYYTNVLSENVETQYFGALSALDKTFRQKRCTDACCRKNPDCAGVAPAEMICRATMRLLYATLPARGFMPLTKKDAVAFTRDQYGRDAVKVVKAATAILRTGGNSIRFADYRPLREFSGRLYSELLDHLGMERNLPASLRVSWNLTFVWPRETGFTL